jgi:hypothetical protein
MRIGVAVAIKVIRPGERDDPGGARPDALAEAAAARQVTHRNAVRIHDLK